MLIEIILFGFVFFLLILLNRPDKELPPGEFGWPIVGVLPQMEGNLLKFFHQVKDKHGNVFCIKVGSRNLVFLKNFEAIKHFAKSELSGRPNNFRNQLARLFSEAGTVLTSGSFWENNRRFSLRHLRNFGFGKSSRMQEIIEKEAQVIVENLQSNLGEPVEVDKSLNLSILNVIWGLVAGTRLEPKSERMLRLSNLFKNRSEIQDGPLLLLTFFPIWAKILPTYVKNKWMKLDKYLQFRKESNDFYEEIIKEHQQTLDKSNARDYIDAYLIEMEEQKDQNIIFTNPIQNLVINLNEFFFAGMDTTASTLRWFMLLMASYPKVQAKLHEELDSNSSEDQSPLLENKDRFPYLQASINEVMRYRTFAPFGVIHSTTKDYYIDGYRIPKDTMVYGCIDEIHHSPQYWENPEEFNPERFLDNDGLLVKNEKLIPFGYGKRICLGESVARMDLFMVSGALMNSFKISCPKDTELDLNINECSFFNHPQPFKLVFEKRK